MDLLLESVEHHLIIVIADDHILEFSTSVVDGEWSVIGEVGERVTQLADSMTALTM